jgi:hypothetical protein
MPVALETLIINLRNTKFYRKATVTSYTENIISQVTKAAILATKHYVKHCYKRTKIFIMGNNITCAIDCNYRIAATLYTLETLFVLGI